MSPAITPDKAYAVVEHRVHGSKAGVIVDDEGKYLFIIYKGSIHLNGMPWIILED